MGLFCDTHYDNEDEEFLIKKRNYKYRYDTFRRNGYDHRFLSFSYMSQLNIDLILSKSNLTPEYRYFYKIINQQVIYKNIGGRAGHRALKNLMNYISRNHDYQIAEGKDKAVLYDSNHSQILNNEFESHQAKFSEDFLSEQFKKNNGYIVDLLECRRENKKTKIDDLKFSIWRVGTTVKIRNDWEQEAIIQEFHNDYIKIKYQTKDGELSDYIKKSDVVPSVTPEHMLIYDCNKVNNLKEMLIAVDDERYSVHKNRIEHLEKKMPTDDFHHLMFSYGGADYDKDIGHSAFRDFLDDSFKRRGFDFIYTYHDDTKNPHYHVICKSQSSIHKRKSFPKGKGDSYILRKELNYHLSRNGIDRSVLRNCDRAWNVEQDLSLFDKIKSYPEKNTFNKGDVYSFISDAMDDYYTNPNSNVDMSDEKHPVALFESRFRKAIYDADNKKDISDIIQFHIKESRDIDLFLHDVMVRSFKSKSKNKGQRNIKRTKERLNENLTKAQSDIEKHPHELSRQQKSVKNTINEMLTYLKEKPFEKARNKSKNSLPNKDKKLEKNIAN